MYVFRCIREGNMYALFLLMYVPKVHTYNNYSNANEADVYNVQGIRTNASLSGSYMKSEQER